MGRPSYGSGASGSGDRRPRRDYRQSYNRRKVCQFCVDKVSYIDYKDVNRLRRFINDRARIEPRRSTGTCAKHQRRLSIAIKRARMLALLPYTPEQLKALGFSRPEGPRGPRSDGGYRGRPREGGYRDSDSRRSSYSRPETVPASAPAEAQPQTTSTQPAATTESVATTELVATPEAAASDQPVEPEASEAQQPEGVADAAPSAETEG